MGEHPSALVVIVRKSATCYVPITVQGINHKNCTLPQGIETIRKQMESPHNGFRVFTVDDLAIAKIFAHRNVVCDKTGQQRVPILDLERRLVIEFMRI